MSEICQALYEALDPLNKIANSIIKKLNYIETSLILKSKKFEDLKDYLDKSASYHSNSYEELSEDKKDIVLKKIWNKIHNILGQKAEEISESDEVLEKRIYDFLLANQFHMYPLQNTAKELANTLKQK